MLVDGRLVMLWPACSHCPDTGPGLTPAGARGPLSTPSPHKTCVGSVCNRGKKAGPGPRKSLPLIGCDKLAATTQRLKVVTLLLWLDGREDIVSKVRDLASDTGVLLLWR